MNQFYISGMCLNPVLSKAEITSTNQVHTVDRVLSMLVNICEEQRKYISEAHLKVIAQFNDDDEVRIRLHRFLNKAHRNITHVENSLTMSDPTIEELKAHISCLSATKTTLDELFNSINIYQE